MFDTPPQYHTFILRFWEERDPNEEEETVWRFSLNDPETDERYGFHTIEALTQFLERQMQRIINASKRDEPIASSSQDQRILGRRSAMKSMEEIQRIKDEVEDELLQRDGVTAVDVGPKYVGGEKTDAIAIRIYVVEKKDVPETDALPREIQGVPTDVRERRFTLHSE
ncbi:MAG: hypothetical protein GY803_29120 [Chloroflexi bacterium]|nr:hypothetical protein [Chloroflexota bacterium]